MLELRSKVTKELVSYFFINEDESLYVNEIVRKFGLDKRNLVKKLSELTSLGLFKMETRGNLKLYSLNKAFPLYSEYKRIFLATAGIEARLKDLVKGVDGIRRAFIFGSCAQGKMDSFSDIDLFVVGEHSTIELQKKIGELQKNFDREINLVSIGSEELEQKKDDPFISEVMKGKKVELL